MAKDFTNITVNVGSVLENLPKDGRRELLRVLNVTDDDLGQSLERLAAAALAELLQMIAVQPMGRTASEVRQFRLFCLARFYLSDRTPNEVEIARLFRIRRNEARRLIEDTRLRFGLALDRPFYKGVVDAITKYAGKTSGDVKFESVGGEIFNAVAEYALEAFPESKQPWKDEKAGAIYFIPKVMHSQIVAHFKQLAE